MRYDNTIYFARETEKTYNPETGNWEGGEPELTKCMASIYDTGTEMLTMVYGKVIQGSLTIHIQNHYHAPFDYIVYRCRKYKVDSKRTLRTKQVFVVSSNE